jgi:hypothetical protein
MNAAAKPWVEFRRKLGPGHYRLYGHVYRRPLRVFLLGRWVWGRPR